MLPRSRPVTAAMEKGTTSAAPDLPGVHRLFRFTLWLALVGVLQTSCAIQNRPLGETGPVVAAMAETVVNRYRVSRPQHFSRVDHIVFTMGGQTRSFIGYTRISRPEGHFSVAGVTPLGIKLFSLSGSREAVEHRYLSPAFAQEGDVAGAIAKDIRRIYLNGVPSVGSTVFFENDTYRFVRREGRGETVYRIAPGAAVLLEKRVRDSLQHYTIRYDGYNGAHAGKIRLSNLRYGYTLTIHLKKLVAPKGS